tara:strand:+ start:3802 stop:4128 length:327 start_codon:yes stop_codon:yes gene_type:complete
MEITKITLDDSAVKFVNQSYPNPGFYEVTQFGATSSDVVCVGSDPSLIPWGIPKAYLTQILEYTLMQSIKNPEHTELVPDKDPFAISENTFLKTLAIVTGKVDNVKLD